MYVNPTVADFKTFFSRAFPYGTDPDEAVLDSDITSALSIAGAYINSGFFSDPNAYNVGFNFLSAHYLIMNLRASSQGVNGQFNFLQSSKSVEAVAESFAIPQAMLDNPLWSMLCKTEYGAQYLASILPQLPGQMFCVRGRTQP